MLAPGRDLTVDEVAETLGLPVAMIRRRIDAGDLPVRWIEVDGRLEVRVPAPGTDGRPGLSDPPAGQPPGSSAPSTPAPLAADPRADPTQAAVVGMVQARRPGLGVPPALADVNSRELIAGLFDRWERALERRIEAEQRLHFETELERRGRQVRELHGELDAVRRAHATELAEREREAMGLREQLREAGDRAARRRSWWRHS
ncbi:MAG TPA: hypothetical protein VMW47_08505 [Verrucomicrobiae bacterium]|nr:hypothetical protein [Verrucomicrobiae bacterium]